MNIEEQVLSREQMAHLKELGIDTSDASMCWIADDSCLNFIPDNNGESEVKWNVAIPSVLLLPYNPIPAYTIGDLIEKLPKETDSNRLEICLGDKTIGYVHFGACAYYENYDGLIDGLYDCLCWVAENHKELIK